MEFVSTSLSLVIALRISCILVTAGSPLFDTSGSSVKFRIDLSSIPSALTSLSTTLSTLPRLPYLHFSNKTGFLSHNIGAGSKLADYSLAGCKYTASLHETTWALAESTTPFPATDFRTFTGLGPLAPSLAPANSVTEDPDWPTATIKWEFYCLGTALRFEPGFWSLVYAWLFHLEWSLVNLLVVGLLT